MAAKKLSASVKKEIMKALYKSAITKAVDRNLLKSLILDQAKAFYQELYGNGELHKSWQTLYKADLAVRLQYVSLDAAFMGGNDSFYEVAKSCGSEDWRMFGEHLGVFWRDRDLTDISLAFDLDSAYPENLFQDAAIRLNANENLARIAAHFRNSVFLELSKAPNNLSALRAVYEVIKSANSVESLVAKLPELEDLITEVIKKKEPSSLPSNVSAAQVKNFLSGLVPIEV